MKYFYFLYDYKITLYCLFLVLMDKIDKNEIIKQLQEYIDGQNSGNNIWHIGQCEEPHCITLNIVKRISNNWMYIETGSGKTAQEIVNFFIDTNGLSCDNRTDNAKGNIVYVYSKKTNK